MLSTGAAMVDRSIPRVVQIRLGATEIRDGLEGEADKARAPLRDVTTISNLLKALCDGAYCKSGGELLLCRCNFFLQLRRHVEVVPPILRVM